MEHMVYGRIVSERLLHVAKYTFWCWNDIRCGRDYCDSTEIMSVADAMASNGMKDVGYEYINLDGIVDNCIANG